MNLAFSCCHHGVVFVFCHQSDYGKASGIFAKNGIVISIKRIPSAIFYWNCVWWSDFCEDERLFIGGLQPFAFSSIRNVPKKLNFTKYIETMTMFQLMIQGYDAYIRRVTKKDANCLKKMVDAEVAAVSGAESEVSVDPYVTALFHHFVENIEEVFVNLTYANIEVMAGFDDYFGYKLFRPMWFGDKAVRHGIWGYFADLS